MPKHAVPVVATWGWLQSESPTQIYIFNPYQAHLQVVPQTVLAFTDRLILSIKATS